MSQVIGRSSFLGQVLRSRPTLVLQLDRFGNARFADRALLDLPPPAQGESGAPAVAQDVADAILAVLPGDFSLPNLQSEYSHDLQLESGADDERYVRLRIVPMAGPRGDIDGFTLHCRDITAQLRLDNVLARKNASLELLLACSSRANRANSFHQALADCLELICSYENWLYPGWLIGHVFVVDDRDPDRLVSSNLWVHPDDLDIEPFVALTNSIRFDRGVGIPGQVLATGNPIWQGRSDKYDKMPRAALADRLGLVSLVAVPVVCGDRVVGVLELHADDERAPDGQQLEVLTAVGREIGLVYERDFANRKLQRLADHDPLTGLVVTRVARDRIGRALALADRQDEAVALLFVDLDGFKEINDGHGHGVGDELLRRVAELLRERVREIDTVARFGGDEFVVLLGGRQSPLGAEQLAADILHALRRPFAFDGFSVQVGASIGISVCARDKVSVDELIRRADAAMYRAKRAGKNCYRFFDEVEPAGGVQSLG